MSSSAASAGDPPASKPPVDWRKWYERTFAGRFPRNDAAAVIDNAVAGGMGHEVVIMAIQEALDDRRRDPLSWGAVLISNWYAAGVRTVQEAEENRRQREEVNHHGRTGSGPGPPGAAAAGPGAVETGGGRARGDRASAANRPRAPDDELAAKYGGFGRGHSPADGRG